MAVLKQNYPPPSRAHNTNVRPRRSRLRRVLQAASGFAILALVVYVASLFSDGPARIGQALLSPFSP